MKEINKSLEDRLTAKQGEFFIHQAVPGEHTFNTAEFTTVNKIKQYELISEIEDKKLIDTNDGSFKYYIVENGFLLKYQKDTFLCMKLDTETMEWIDSPELISIFFDSALRFQELPGFKDFYQNQDQTKLNGRQL